MAVYYDRIPKDFDVKLFRTHPKDLLGSYPDCYEGAIFMRPVIGLPSAPRIIVEIDRLMYVAEYNPDDISAKDCADIIALEKGMGEIVGGTNGENTNFFRADILIKSYANISRGCGYEADVKYYDDHIIPNPVGAVPARACDTDGRDQSEDNGKRIYRGLEYLGGVDVGKMDLNPERPKPNPTYDWLELERARREETKEAAISAELAYLTEKIHYALLSAYDSGYDDGYDDAQYE